MNNKESRIPILQATIIIEKSGHSSLDIEHSSSVHDQAEEFLKIAPENEREIGSPRVNESTNESSEKGVEDENMLTEVDANENGSCARGFEGFPGEKVAESKTDTVIGVDEIDMTCSENSITTPIEILPASRYGRTELPSDDMPTVTSTIIECGSISSDRDDSSSDSGRETISSHSSRRNFKIQPSRRRRKMDMTDLTQLASLIKERMTSLELAHKHMHNSSSTHESLLLSKERYRVSYIEAARDIVNLGRGIATAWMQVVLDCSDKRLAQRLKDSLSKTDTLASQMRAIVSVHSGGEGVVDKVMDNL